MESAAWFSPFRNGYWTWDEVIQGLSFVSNEFSKGSVSLATAVSRATTRTATNGIKFRDTVDNLEQIKFRRLYQRRCKPADPKVITIQDVKDVAIFLARPQSLSIDFINYFHIPTMDRFLRALIIYFQYYVQVWENMLLRREEEKRKLYQPRVTILENIIRDDMADLRSMVAREYCSILMGNEDAKQFHHMSNNEQSLSDKDRRLFEMFICMAIRVIWIALQRKHFSLIELELNRMLRSDFFNIIEHQSFRGLHLRKTSEENRVILGTVNTDEKKLLQRSPITKELLLCDHDHRMLGIGIAEFAPTDERLQYLEAAYSAPEEELRGMEVTVGLLGLPRSEFDAMLMLKPRIGRRNTIVVRKIQLEEFKIPPRVCHADETMPKTFPEKPPVYKETRQNIEARVKQHKLWRNVITKVSLGQELSACSEITLQSQPSRLFVMQKTSSIGERYSKSRQ